jgi:hypothetical protein
VHVKLAVNDDINFSSEFLELWKLVVQLSYVSHLPSLKVVKCCVHICVVACGEGEERQWHLNCVGCGMVESCIISVTLHHYQNFNNQGDRL